MLTIALCIMVIFFIVLMIRDNKHINARDVYKHWILFTGITFTLATVIFQLFGARFFLANGFDELQLKLILIYNSFMRMVGVSFIFVWVIFFFVFDIAGKIDRWIESFNKKHST